MFMYLVYILNLQMFIQKELSRHIYVPVQGQILEALNM